MDRTVTPLEVRAVFKPHRLLTIAGLMDRCRFLHQMLGYDCGYILSLKIKGMT